MLSTYLSMLNDPEDEKKFEQIYFEYRDLMMRFAMRVLKNHHDAEDAVQEAFYALAKNFESWSNCTDEAIKRYVYKTIRSTSIDSYRKKERSEEPLRLEDILDCRSEINIPQEFTNNETYLQLLDILSNMPIQYREVLSLYWIDNLKPKEIASMLHRPIETVRSQLKRGNTMLKKQVKGAVFHDKT